MLAWTWQRASKTETIAAGTGSESIGKVKSMSKESSRRKQTVCAHRLKGKQQRGDNGKELEPEPRKQCDQHKNWLCTYTHLLKIVCEVITPIVRQYYCRCRGEGVKCTYCSILGKCPWVLKHNWWSWPAWVLTQDINLIAYIRMEAATSTPWKVVR